MDVAQKKYQLILVARRSSLLRPIAFRPCFTTSLAQQNKFELNKVGQAWGKGKDKNNWQTSPSLDRIVPEKGYVKDNIIIVSLMANSIKNQATPDQIQKVATFYKKLYTEKGLTYVN